MPLRIRSAAFISGVGPAVARFDQLQLARLEGVVGLLPLLRQLHDKLVEFGKAAFQFLDLDHHFREELFALLRRVADVEVVDDTLVQQLELRVELGRPLDRRQLLNLDSSAQPGSAFTCEKMAEMLSMIVVRCVASSIFRLLTISISISSSAAAGRRSLLRQLLASATLVRASMRALLGDTVGVGRQGVGSSRKLTQRCDSARSVRRLRLPALRRCGFRRRSAVRAAR